MEDPLTLCLKMHLLILFVVGITRIPDTASASASASVAVQGRQDKTAGGFAFACFWPGNVLTGDKYGVYTAACPPAKDVTWRMSELNLNHCLLNNHGQLAWLKE